MKRLAAIWVLGSLAIAAHGQSLTEYLKLRHQNGIDHAIALDTLRNAEKTRTAEVKGVVKGSFKQGPHVTLLMGLPSGGTQEVEADFVPDWVVAGDDTPARLLVKAIKDDAGAPPRIVLLATAKDADIQPLDDALAAKHKVIETAAQKKAAKAEGRSRLRRGGLWGPIGRHSTHDRAAGQWVLPANSVTPIYASYIRRVNPKLTEAQASRIAQGIVGFCLQYQVDARLVMAVIIVESGFDPTSVSRSGAMGLGQLMPGTARWMGVNNPFDDLDNIYGMVKLLRTHLTQYYNQTGDMWQSLQLALAAYNAGEGAVRRHGGIPPYRETQAYVRRVISIYQDFIQ